MIRVLNRYLLREFFKSFIVTAGILTFVMYIGAVIQAIDYLARGISGPLILKIFALNIPFTLSFVIPMSVLTAVLLHFGRLSADGEITAMKSCGISLWQISAPLVFCSIWLSLVCLYLNASLAPRSHLARRQMLRDLGEEDPLSLLEEGRFVSDFPGVKIYVGKKSGPELEDIILSRMDERGTRAEVRARAGRVAFQPGNQLLDIQLFQARMTEYDREHPDDLSRARTLSAESYPLRLDLRQMLKKNPLHKKPASMTFSELLAAVRQIRQTFPDIQEKNIPRMRTKLAVEANKRLVLALSCFSFTLLGIPLGIRAHRRESSIGIAIALVLLFIFYLFLILAESLLDRPEWRPDLIPWIPAVGSQLIGFLLLRRHQ